MTTALDMDRRSFIKLVGGGVVVFVCLGPSALLGQDRRRAYPTDVNAYLRIGEDGRVTVFSGKIEMGQGVLTSQAQMAAEELGVPLGAIDMILGDTDRCPWDMGTFGSLTTRMFGPALRAACAEARGVMIQLASEHLEVPKENLAVSDGVVTVKGDPKRKVSYGELAKGKAIGRTLDEKAVLRSISEFREMGRSPLRLDGREKTTGAAKYAGDIRLPGMLYARILRPPAHGATLASVDTSAAAKLSGVTVVNRYGLVAVLHADPEIAGKALDAVKGSWSKAEPGADQDGIFDDLLKHAVEPEVKGTKGDLEAGLSGGAKHFDETYHKGYVAHAPMEPHSAAAEMKEGKLTIWASTQTPFPTRDRIARMLGLDEKNVRVITPYVGGGFGGKSAGLQADEAAKLAVATGKPVMVAWTRSEEFFYDTFDPACIVKIESAVDSNGKISMWDYTVWFAGDRSTDLFYDVPNVRVRVSGGWMGRGSDTHRFGVGPWRAPGANMNVWARESQIDIMAAAAGVDPLEFRLRNLKDERMIGVLKAVAKKFGWTPAPAPSGRGVAVACGIDAGSYAALMAEVKVDRVKGTVKVERVVCAQDMGLVVNPDGATMQVEGSITQGLGYVFTEELRIQGGEILDRNFDSYELPRFSWVPKIETVLVKNDELPPQGGGEPAIVPMGAVIANALFDACGARVRRLPITPKRLKEALATAARKT
ncbi:MAG: molybdopterin-dependent oxidoreductase [Acidobacteriia bacterium]|nr:molybdopterin-dependent oxidoreductase [Terriglobia bacterium]